MPKFSIVMPVYNTEDYLKTAVESVLNQDFNDFELILVDDCSTDSSSLICDELEFVDSRIKTIHLEVNKGLSTVRNVGIDNSQGEYIFFMDSDDRIEPDLLSVINKSSEENPAQAIMFGFIEDYYNKNLELKESYEVVYPSFALNNKEDVRKEIIDIEKSTLFGYSCNKFYSLNYLKQINIEFQTIRLIEDFLFNLHFFENVRTFNCVEYAGYHYNKRVNQSLTGRFVEEYFELQVIRVSGLLEQYKKWNMCNDEIKTALANIYVRYIFSALQRNCDTRSNLTHKERKEWLNNLYNQDLYNELIPYSSPDTKLVSFMSKNLKKRKNYMLLSIGRTIFVVKNKLPIFFAKIKQNK
ncbi:MAG: glycosyltransferase family A protein [Acutalibacteraceae bacterium]